MNITYEQLKALSAAVALAGYYIEDHQGSSFFDNNDLIDFKNALAALDSIEAQL